MQNPSIKFGTDGWRAVIGDTFTFANLEVVARATAQWLHRRYGEAPKVILGHDTRFMGRQFAEHAARVLADEGVHVLFADGFAPTPAVSWAAAAYGCSAGIVITASHNPPEYNGFKIKADFGGPATPEMIEEVEAEMAQLRHPSGSLPAFRALVGDGRVELRNLTDDYLGMLRERLDLDAIRAAGLRVAHDAMYGAAQGLVSRLIGHEHVVELRSNWNPGFKGRAPEPIERNLHGLAEAVVREGCDAGLANDGDADRIGMYDEHGAFVDSHRLLSLLVKYLYQERGLRGDVVKTFSSTHMIDRMGEAYGLNVITTPIGFKYIASHIVEGDVLVGGEESGGMAVKGHLPERDGLYIGLLVVEMMVKRGMTLSALVRELSDEFGPHVARRIDVHTTEAKKQAVLARLKGGGGLDRIAGRAVRRHESLDGFKHLLDDGWLLVRPSGTEPVLRVYSESTSAEAADALIDDALVQLGVRDDVP